MTPAQRISRIHELHQEIKKLEFDHAEALLKLLQSISERDEDDKYRYMLDGMEKRRKDCQAAIGEHVGELLNKHPEMLMGVLDEA